MRFQVKFKKEELHRLPEFDDAKPDMASMSASTSTGPLYPNQHQANVVTPTRQPMQQNQTKPLSSIPTHVRSEIPSLGSTSISGISNAISADVKGKGPAHPTGLNTPITPLHPPPQRPNLKPPQYQHQPERRVSFADHQQEPTSKPAAAATMDSKPKHSPADFDADDSFGFNSDDDALFALADLGPPIDPDGADEGRPIGSDEGRPINTNEGHLGAGSADDTMIGDDVFDQHQHQKKNEPSLVGVVSASKLSRQEMITTALMSAEESGNTSDSPQRCPSGSNHTTSGTSNTLLQANAGMNISSSILGLAQQHNQNQKPALNLTSLAQQRHQRHVDRRQNQNENPNQMGLLSSSSTRVESKRASTPSIGGFHFPAGIVCPRLFRRDS